MTRYSGAEVGVLRHEPYRPGCAPRGWNPSSHARVLVLRAGLECGVGQLHSRWLASDAPERPPARHNESLRSISRAAVGLGIPAFRERRIPARPAPCELLPTCPEGFDRR